MHSFLGRYTRTPITRMNNTSFVSLTVAIFVWINSYKGKRERISGVHFCPLTFNSYGHIKAAQQRTVIQLYGDWYTGC